MKKLLLGLIVICSIFVLIGCGSNEKNTAQDGTKKTATAEEKINEEKFFVVNNKRKEFNLDGFLEACGIKNITYSQGCQDYTVSASCGKYKMEIKTIPDRIGISYGATEITLWTESDIYFFGNTPETLPAEAEFVQCKISSCDDGERIGIDKNTFDALVKLAKSGTLKKDGTECPFKGMEIPHSILSATNQWQEHND